MKKSILSLVAICALAGSAIAGPVGGWGKASYDKTPVPPPPPAGCDCFGPGVALDLMTGYVWSDSQPLRGDGWGLGAGATYFMNEFVGIGGRYFVFDNDYGSEEHDLSASVILRYPIPSLCIAPYVFGGGGLVTNSDTKGTAHIGGGLDIRIVDCMGGFVDARYTWADKSGNYTSLNFGLRMSF